jgi:hypothetical protein
MSTRRIEALVAGLAVTHDDELVNEARSEHARTTLRAIMESPLQTGQSAAPRPVRRDKARRRPVRLIAVAVALVAAALLSIPAFGIGKEIVSLFAGGRDPGAPVPTASDVLIASGEAGVPWKLVATGSDQGLCLGLFNRAGGDSFGAAGCDYRDIRGELPRDLRGDPAQTCIGPPTQLEPGGTLTPCGSLPKHAIDVGGGVDILGLTHRFAFGPLSTDVASVDIILTDGRTRHAHVVERPDGLPLNFYWTSWRCPLRSVDEGPYAGEGLRYCAEDRGPDVEMAIARDADGRMLERRVPAWNLNPTGDPDGPAPPTKVP